MAEHTNTSSIMDEPEVYRIRVRGRLNDRWMESMWANVSVTVREGDPDPETILLGQVADQAHLLGIVNALYNMGYAVIGLEQVFSEEGDPVEESQSP